MPDPAVIEAARITAHATIQAAWTQLGASVAVILAALLAGSFAYRSATRQVRLQENQAKAKAEAYGFMLTLVVQELLPAAVVECHHAQGQLDQFSAGDTAGTVRAMPFSMAVELGPEKWVDHAMLGLAAVSSIRRVHEALSEVIRFNTEMRGRLWTETSAHPTWGAPVETADGGSVIQADNAVQNHAKVAEELLEAVLSLDAVLGSSKRRGPGMKREDAYEIAAAMLQREHARWIQNALVLFGSLLSILLLYRDFKDLVPMWVLMLIGSGISGMVCLVALSIRRSTDAWTATLKEIEKSATDVATFQLFETKLEMQTPVKDLIFTGKGLKGILLSVTRLYTLAAVAVCLVFFIVSICLVIHGKSASVQKFRHGDVAVDVTQ